MGCNILLHISVENTCNLLPGQLCFHTDNYLYYLSININLLWIYFSGLSFCASSEWLYKLCKKDINNCWIFRPRCYAGRCSWIFCSINRKTFCRSLFFSRIIDWKSGSLLLKRLRYKCFHMSFEKFFKRMLNFGNLGRVDIS